MARLPSVVLTRVYKFFLAFAGLSLWKRDANGDYTQASADASPQLLADDNVSSMTSMPVGSLLVDPVNGRLYVANSSGTPELVPQAGSNATFGDNVVLYFGDGNDIGVTWDGTDLVVSQLTANSAVKWGVDGAGLDQFWYGDTASAYLQWDQSADTLLFAGTAKLGVVNRSIGASTAAAGSATGDSGVLPAGTAPVYPTSAADGTKGVRIHASDNVTGRQIFVANGVSNQILKIYPPTGGTINGASADAAYSTASGKGALLTCLNSSTSAWAAIG